MVVLLLLLLLWHSPIWDWCATRREYLLTWWVRCWLLPEHFVDFELGRFHLLPSVLELCVRLLFCIDWVRLGRLCHVHFFQRTDRTPINQSFSHSFRLRVTRTATVSSIFVDGNHFIILFTQILSWGEEAGVATFVKAKCASLLRSVFHVSLLILLHLIFGRLLLPPVVSHRAEIFGDCTRVRKAFLVRIDSLFTQDWCLDRQVLIVQATLQCVLLIFHRCILEWIFGSLAQHLCLLLFGVWWQDSALLGWYKAHWGWLVMLA